MKRIKGIIILLIILLLILIIFLLSILSINSKNNKDYNNIIEENAMSDDINLITFKDIENYETYYTVKSILSKYMDYIKHITGDEYIDTSKINMSNEEIRKTLQSDGITAIKNILDKEYLSDMHIEDSSIIEKQNIYKQSGNYDKNVEYDLNIDNVKEIELENNINLILIKSKINNIPFDLLMKMDNYNKTYSIFLSDYVEKYNYNENMSREDIKIDNAPIEKNDYNFYTDINITDEYIVAQYFSDYRMKMLNDTENAFYMLDENYRNNKFADYEEFNKFILNNKSLIENASIEGYQVKEFDKQKEYVCIDQNGKYYIFEQLSPTKYTVILDTYTIDLPDFIEKYSVANDAQKAGYNIQKIFSAINDGDYNYVYNKLDSTFKQNNFPTLDSFETYIKQNFYENNSIGYSNYKTSGDLHIYEISITNSDDENSQEITKNFIMQLKDGTDFVMSFNV